MLLNRDCGGEGCRSCNGRCGEELSQKREKKTNLVVVLLSLSMLCMCVCVYYMKEGPKEKKDGEDCDLGCFFGSHVMVTIATQAATRQCLVSLSTQTSFVFFLLWFVRIHQMSDDPKCPEEECYFIMMADDPDPVLLTNM